MLVCDRQAGGSSIVRDAPPDLPLGNAFGLRKLTAQESGDFYDALVERDRRAARLFTSNRAEQIGR